MAQYDSIIKAKHSKQQTEYVVIEAICTGFGEREETKVFNTKREADDYMATIHSRGAMWVKYVKRGKETVLFRGSIASPSRR
jgi:hypothetical protein